MDVREELQNLHHGSATEGDNKHEEPVGNKAESPHNVTKGNSKAKLSELAVEGVEEALGVNTLQVLLYTGFVPRGKSLSGGSGQVDALLVNLVDGGLGEHVNDIEGGGTGRPGVAENGLVVTVEVANVGSVIEERELGSRFVECLLNLAAVTCNCVLALIIEYYKGRIGASIMSQCAVHEPNVPKQVLFPPETRTHHSSGVVAPGETGS